MKVYQYYNLVLHNVVSLMNPIILLVEISIKSIFNDMFKLYSKSYGNTFLMKTSIVLKVIIYPP